MNRVYFRRSFDMHWTDYVPAGYWEEREREMERAGREAWVLGKAKQRILDLEARVERLERLVPDPAPPTENT